MFLNAHSLQYNYKNYLCSLLFAMLAAGEVGAQPTHNGVDRLSDTDRQLIIDTFWEAPADKPAHSRFSGNSDAIKLGEFAFYSKALSQGSDMACATCHDPAKDWTDGRAVAINGNKNVPTLWGVAFQDWLFWDGRADSTWSQVSQVLENPAEHNLAKTHLLQKLYSVKPLRQHYEQVFGTLTIEPSIATANPCASNNSTKPDCVTSWSGLSQADQQEINTVFVNVAKSIAAFIETIEAPDTRFDQFLLSLQDDSIESVLNSKEIHGLKLFIGKGGCSSCHSGRYLRDGEFHDVRVPSSTPEINAARFNGIRALLRYEFSLLSNYNDMPDTRHHTRFIKPTDADWGAFKTPTLRRIAYTAPYMHEGQLATLEQVIDHYSEFSDATVANHHIETFLVPLMLNPQEKSALLAFLKTL